MRLALNDCGAYPNISMIGNIHSIETCGTVDGPGIRFVVFMQGCPLRCKYCHNRDTWDISNGTEYDVDFVLNMIMRSKPFLDSSHGGVTISGGEDGTKTFTGDKDDYDMQEYYYSVFIKTGKGTGEQLSR